MKVSILLTFIVQWISVLADETDYSSVNPDGSYQFGYSNSDQGGHYHTSSGNNAIKVRGRYGSRNPASGQIDETVYTAGPRGFRARGPNIHRKQSLSQAQRGPIGAPDDPLADPYDDASYGFGFKTNTYQRKEEADTSGRVQGEYHYVDDAGEKHDVKYKAGAGTGFEVENGVPDSPQNIRYNTPLYKSNPKARGKITFERGPDKQYKFLTSSPDQRRAEATGPDGITRGSYSYLDDKGVQRTVQYIAGAGIGYKIVQSTVGPGTHIAANADVPEYSIKQASNELTGPDDGSVYHTAPSAPSGPGYSPSSTPFPPYNSGGGYSSTPFPPSGYPQAPQPSIYPQAPHPSPYPQLPQPRPYPSLLPRPFSRNPDPVFLTKPTGIDRNYITPTVSTYPTGPATGPSQIPDNSNTIYGLLPPREDTPFSNQYVPPSSQSPTISAPTPYYQPPVYHTGPDSNSPFSTNSLYQPPASEYYNPPTGQSGTQIKNTGPDWYHGIPPGGVFRAHIQSIDLVPAHERALSPSEALRIDEERDAQQNQHSHSHSHKRSTKEKTPKKTPTVKPE
ncbi:unnamed protein product [Diamesa hyperborea]